MLPKLYQIKHPSTPYQVVFVDPRGKRVRRHFSVKKKAEKYHRALLGKSKVAGTAGLVLDVEMRAEYFSAKRALDGVPLLTAVAHYLRHRPVGLASLLLVDVLKIFLKEKERTGRTKRTVEALDSAVALFLANSEARLAADYTREMITLYLDKLQAPVLTIRTHRARLSAFGEWMARRQYIPENPVRYIDVATYDPRPPRVLTPVDAEKLMRRAAEYRGGMFALTYAVALYAGLRYSEILALKWEDVRLTGTPIIRVGHGKIRGRRSVRVIPIQPALLSWLKWGEARKLPLVSPSSDSRKVREVVSWQTDIARHSWISSRLALVADEAQVAREAGNSPDVIYRHYFQLVTRADALRYFSNWA